jgi:hypothetical protein
MMRAFASFAAVAVVAAYPGPMDFNCTTIPLDVTFDAAPGKISCGTQMHKTDPGLADAPKVDMGSAESDAGYTLMVKAVGNNWQQWLLSSI